VSGGMQQINGIDVILYQTTINTGDESYYMYTVSPGSPYIRLSLDYTGKGRLLAWNSTTSSWAIIIEVPNSCDLYASLVACSATVTARRQSRHAGALMVLSSLTVSTSLEDAREGKH